MSDSVLLLLFLAAVRDATANPCSTADPTADMMAQPIRLPSCGSFDDEPTLLAALCATAEEHDGGPVCMAMRRGWSDAVRLLVPRTSASGATKVRHFAEHRRKEATAVVQLLQGAAHTKAAVVVPAVQWAQNSSLVAIAVRFSPKKHGPVSVASVEQPKVLITEKHLSFSAAGLSVNGGKHLRFELELPLAHAIDAEASTWSAAPGGGRLTVQLAKGTVGERWRTLATPPAADGSGARRGHISTW